VIEQLANDAIRLRLNRNDLIVRMQQMCRQQVLDAYLGLSVCFYVSFTRVRFVGADCFLYPSATCGTKSSCG